MPTLSGKVANFSFPTNFRLGAGRVRELPSVLRDAGIAKALVVVDSGIANGEVFAQVRSALAGSEFAVFSEVRSDPDLECVRDAARAFRESGADGVLAVGGGSALDAGKAAAFALNQSRPLREFEDVGDNWRRANPDIPPIVAVPTTAGTGSEVGRAAVVSDSDGKRVLFHPKMLPAAAIADPALIQTLPKHLTAATGFDALTHALEALCAPGFHPMCDGIALEALRLVRANLPRACENGGDLEARAAMMTAAMMGAVAFQKGLGAAHSLSHPLGFHFKIHHGLLNAIVLPYVVARNLEADTAGEVAAKLSRLSRHLELTPPDADGALRWLLDLRRELQIPNTLAEVVPEETDDSRRTQIVRMAVTDPTAATNPVPLDEALALRMLNAALAGEV